MPVRAALDMTGTVAITIGIALDAAEICKRVAAVVYGMAGDANALLSGTKPISVH